MAWLTGYNYRKKITVAAGTGAGTNYQQLLLVGESAGAAGENFDLVEHCQDFPNDIRFTDNDETTLLDHWLESVSGATPNRLARFWVEVADDLGSNVDVCCYYGKAADSSASNGDNTFAFFDDFNVLSISSFSTLINTATYDYFGTTFRLDSNTLMHLTRTGATHVDNTGKIIKATYNISTGVWSGYTTIYDSDYDDRNVSGGMVGTDIFAFFARYDGTNWIDIGYIKSSDEGITWGSYTPISVSPLTEFSPYGHIVQVGATFYQPFYGSAGANHYVKLFESTDNGTTWSVGPTIYSGASTFSETSIEYIGNNKLIAVMRRDSPTGADSLQGVYQSVSEDGGTTWSAPAQTNLGHTDGNSVVPGLIYDSETNEVIITYADRTDYTINVSKEDADIIFSSPTSWGTKDILVDDSVDVAYSSMVKISSNTYYVVWGREVSASDVDLTGGYWFPTPKWKLMRGTTPTVSAGILTLDNGWIWNYDTFGQNSALRTKAKMSATTVRQEWGYSSQTVVGASDDIANSAGAYAAGYWHSANVYYIQNKETAQTQLDGGAYDIDWHIMEIVRNGNVNVQYTRDGAQVTNSPITTNIPSTAGYIHLLDYLDTAGNAQYDWIFVRKHTATPPAYSSAGGEETSVLLKVISEVINIGETKNYTRDRLKIISEVINISELKNKLQAKLRIINELLNISEAKNKLQNKLRVINEVSNITELKNKLQTKLRIISESINIVEAKNYLRNLTRIISEVANVAEIKNYFRGRVKVISESLSVVENFIRRIIVRPKYPRAGFKLKGGRKRHPFKWRFFDR